MFGVRRVRALAGTSKRGRWQSLPPLLSLVLVNPHCASNPFASAPTVMIG
jgi:hypothetical protein